jgi:hypothetical protein
LVVKDDIPANQNFYQGESRKSAGRDVKIKNRKVTLRRIYVPLGACTFIPIHTTDKQLARLNRIPDGKEAFLSNRYCQIGSYFWVIRTKGGLQFRPNAYPGSKEGIGILESMLGDQQPHSL